MQLALEQVEHPHIWKKQDSGYYTLHLSPEHSTHSGNQVSERRILLRTMGLLIALSLFWVKGAPRLVNPALIVLLVSGSDALEDLEFAKWVLGGEFTQFNDLSVWPEGTEQVEAAAAKPALGLLMANALEEQVSELPYSAKRNFTLLLAVASP
jgi:hypothetical protein